MNLLPLGYFSKPHGIKGNLILKDEHDFLVEELKVIFIEMQGNRAPYFISQISQANNGFIIGLEDIDSIEKARTLVGKKVFIDEKLLLTEDEFTYVGFELIDKTFGSLGTVNDVMDNGEQTLVTVQFRGKEVILPLVEKFIGNIDEVTRKIFINSPEGLIDLYLNHNEGDEDAEEDEAPPHI